MSGSWDDDVTFVSDPDTGGPGPEPGQADGSRLAAGQMFGPYRIARLLGRGGMGEVYEAEHVEHGRRIALKVLNRQLAGPDDRERFLREGQLAAALNHPHTVYVFGSEEVAGTPVITMELVPGGTLKERVEREGPLAPAQAVDAALQLVAGLEAAHAGGILHRDVKPANCFLDAGGTVKIGDFGLSIPAVAPDVTVQAQPASFQGTPHYAAPEQLRGQPVDVRADIYAVGATLYYLLTGRPPFDDRELLALVTRIATDTPAPPAREGVRIPPGLSAVVLTCLSKDPAGRFATYASLRERLHPFSSSVPAPAGLGIRFAAGVIDWLILTVAAVPFGLLPTVALDSEKAITASVTFTDPTGEGASWGSRISFLVVLLLYYALLEGIGTASIGKRICGLAVTTPSGEPAGLPRAAFRTIVFLSPRLLRPIGGAVSWAATVWSGLIFLSMRRRNGWAALHDLVSGTRVTARELRQARATLDAREGGSAPAQMNVPDGGEVGPFQVVGELGGDAGECMRLGFDRRLRRHVWVRMMPPGSPAVPDARRDVGRPGRLRWVAGRRSDTEAWDAYEAPDGQPLTAIVAVPQPWGVVKHWVLDLAQELAAAGEDGTMPVLALDRVWITSRNEARLLDVPAPGFQASEARPPGGPAGTPQQFLSSVTLTALGTPAGGVATGAGRPEPLPALARATIDTLSCDGFTSMREVADRAGLLAAGHDRVTRGRRAASLALANVPLILTLIALVVVVPTAVRVVEPDAMAMTNCLIQLRSLEGRDDAAASDRRALQLYVSDRFGSVLSDEDTWTNPRTTKLMAPLRATAARALASGPASSAAERAAAEDVARPFVAQARGTSVRAVRVGVMIVALVLFASAVGALVVAVVLGGPLGLRLLGLAAVGAAGYPAGRLRAASRSVAAWSPVWLWWLYAWVWTFGGRQTIDSLSDPGMVALVVTVLASGAWWSLRSPSRGAADRLTGTWIVPR